MFSLSVRLMDLRCLNISECENGRADPYPIPTCLPMNVVPQRSLQKPGLVKISKSNKTHREMVKIIFEEQKK